MLVPYTIPAAPLAVTDTIKKSRFITFIAHTPTVEVAKAWIQTIKQQHPTACHHCWAFVAGAPHQSHIYGCSDDGEPSGTAGKPMLAQLMGAGLGEVAAVVVRYYGGIQLGTGGLVKAYGGGVNAALKQLLTHLKRPQIIAAIYCDYSDMGIVEAVIAHYQGQLITADYGQSVTLRVGWAADEWEQVGRVLADRIQGRLSLHALDG